MPDCYKSVSQVWGLKQQEMLKRFFCFVLCVGVSSYMYVSIPHVCLVPSEVTRGCQIIEPYDGDAGNGLQKHHGLLSTKASLQSQTTLIYQLTVWEA